MKPSISDSILFFIFTFAVFVPIAKAEKSFQICNGVFLMDGKIKLNKNEKILVCGVDDGPQGWRDIPLTQIEFHMRAILQNLGYLNPRFSTGDDQIFIWRGDQAEVKDLIVEGTEGLLNPKKKRNIVGNPMTPAKLNEVESWANLKIRSQGHACFEMKVEGQRWDGIVKVSTVLDEKKSVGNLNPNDLDGLNPEILRRYQPFEIGETYNIRKTQIMIDRILKDGLFQSAFFETECAQDKVNLSLITSIGRPKILRFGIGASTDELPFVDITFKNTRLDNEASSVTTTLHSSPRLLRFTADSELYWFRGWHQTFFAPRFKLSRDIEPAFQTDSGATGADIGFKWDQWENRFLGRGGPTINTVKTVRGIGPNANYLTIDSSLTVMSHSYESSIWQQQEGWNGSLIFRGQRRGLGSQVDVNRYEINAKYLWNISDYDPPLFVLGTRVKAISVDAHDLNDEASVAEIPPEDRIFVGGDDDLRGFPRQSINNQQVGFLSFFYLGFDLRLVEVLPYHIQPLVLWDLGKTGLRRYTLDAPVFISEGVGLRWLSPFGTFRGSYARGRILHQNDLNTSYPENWVFFLSFGQEF